MDRRRFLVTSRAGALQRLVARRGLRTVLDATAVCALTVFRWLVP